MVRHRLRRYNRLCCLMNNFWNCSAKMSFLKNFFRSNMNARRQHVHLFLEDLCSKAARLRAHPRQAPPNFYYVLHGTLQMPSLCGSRGYVARARLRRGWLVISSGLSSVAGRQRPRMSPSLLILSTNMGAGASASSTFLMSVKKALKSTG